MKKILVVFLVCFLFMAIPFASTKNFPTDDLTIRTYFGNLTNLSEMQDVNIPTPADDEVLTYDTGIGKWISKAVSAIMASIKGLDQSNNQNSLLIVNGSDYLGYDQSVLNSSITTLAYNGTLAYNSSLSNYYLITNPFGYYNSTTLTTNSQLANGNNYWNSTFATFNETHADTLYAPLGSAGNPFDQVLNTTDNVYFNIINSSMLRTNGSDYLTIYDDTINSSSGILQLETEVVQLFAPNAQGYFESIITLGAIEAQTAEGHFNLGTSGGFDIALINGSYETGITDRYMDFNVLDDSGSGWANVMRLYANGSVNMLDGGNLETAGNITADYYFGDGSQLTGINTGVQNSTAWNRSGTNVYLANTGGNVGIGTTSPLADLHINGTTRIVGDAAEPLLIGRDEFNLWVFRNTHGALGIDANSLIIKPSGIYGVDSDFAIKTTTADSGTPNFVVKASGNVGIGTNAPKNKLDVEGGMVIGATYSGTNTAPSNGLLVEGNVGIGTTSPGVKLEVNGGSYIGAPTLGTVSGHSYLTGTDGNFGLMQGISSSGDTWLQSQRTDGPSTVYNIKLQPAGGNVGIGTSPSYKLDVAGSINGYDILINGTSLSAGSLGAVTGSGTAWSIPMWNGTTSLNNSNIYQLGENVGIGTATPQNTLNVIGDGNFTGTLTIANGTAVTHAVTLGQLQSINNSVTGDYVPYTGATDNVDLGLNSINIGEGETYLYDGVQALKLAKGTSATLYENTFVGVEAGNSTAQSQTASGYRAGYLNTGAYQTASGFYAGRENTGAGQTASGYQAGYLNTGAYQTASGYYAGRQNTGASQTASGYLALIYNDGDYNTAFGNNAFNTWTDDISEDVDAVLYESNQVTITGHGFGAVGRILNLVATTTDTLPTGLSGIQQWEVVDANTLSCKTDTFSDAGVGTLTLTSNTIFTNSLALGNDAEPDASNQAVIGNSALTQVKTAGSIYSSGTGDNYFAGDVGIGTITSTAYLHIKAGTATASTAPLKLTTGINLTTPEAGTIEYDGCSFFITNVASQKAIDRTSDVALSTVTVQNTTGETTIWTGPMAANSLCAGNVFKFHANGLISSDSVGDLITIRIKVGGVTKATLEGAAKKLEDDHFHIDAVATQRTIGGSGSRAIHIDMIIDEIEYSVTSVATIDTTTNMDVTITAQWNNQDVGNILELYQGFMEYKN